MILVDCCLSDTSKGPFSLSCLTKWWLDSGCFVQGLQSPTRGGNNKFWNGKTVGEVKADMRLYRKYALEGRLYGGKSYVQSCFGENISPGNVRGVNFTYMYLVCHFQIYYHCCMKSQLKYKFHLNN